MNAKDMKDVLKELELGYGISIEAYSAALNANVDSRDYLSVLIEDTLSESKDALVKELCEHVEKLETEYDRRIAFDKQALTELESIVHKLKPRPC